MLRNHGTALNFLAFVYHVCAKLKKRIGHYLIIVSKESQSMLRLFYASTAIFVVMIFQKKKLVIFETCIDYLIERICKDILKMVFRNFSNESLVHIVLVLMCM